MKSSYILFFSIIFSTSIVEASEHSKMTISLDGGYLSKHNKLENTELVAQFNQEISEWQENLPTELSQSDYEQSFLAFFGKAVSEGKFTNDEVQLFKQQLAAKGIIQEAMERAGISQGFANWVGSHEVEARNLLVGRLAGRLETVKDQTPDEIKGAIRTFFGNEVQVGSKGFASGSFFTLSVIGVIWSIKYWFFSKS